ncbi:RNA polymerase sigma factor [Corallococcus sp. CA049B]|uniref:RNA polymerase sigma factor n=1 Tax=Corallococcus sp. CA049B TaxID=2316730 RepID=UPI002101B8E8|nr:RNA polymerase sigma factor [Corallococcus sp. CA049B]
MSISSRGHRLGELAMQHRGWLMGQALKLCRNETDAEDLVQETLLRFVKTFEDREPLPERSTCVSWLTNTLSHLFYSQCRKQQVRKQHANDPVLAERAGLAPEQGVASEFNVPPEQLARAVSQLSPEKQATFELYGKGKKYREIASALGIQVGTVSKRLHDIRVQLGKLLRTNDKVN